MDLNSLVTVTNYLILVYHLYTHVFEFESIPPIVFSVEVLLLSLLLSILVNTREIPLNLISKRDELFPSPDIPINLTAI